MTDPPTPTTIPPTLIRVRYAEVDPFGYVYHSNYFPYFEQARGEAARWTGTPYTAYEANGVAMPLRSMGITFRRPARYDDLLAVCCHVAQLTPVRMRIEYHVYVVAARVASLVCTGFTEHVFTDMTGRPTRASRVPAVWESVTKIATAPDYADLVALGLADEIIG